MTAAAAWTGGPWAPAMLNSRTMLTTKDRRGHYRALVLDVGQLSPSDVVAEARGATEAEAQARAHLIASAPELAEALDRLNILLLADNSDGTLTDESRREAQKIVTAGRAKARGGRCG